MKIRRYYALGVGAAGLAALAVLGCAVDASSVSDPEMGSDQQAPIIGGNKFASASRWTNGLVRVNFGCSGAVIAKDWVVTAAHCVQNWATPDSNSVVAFRKDGRRESTRSVEYVVSGGAADQVLLKLKPATADMEWPEVTRNMYNAAPATLRGQTVTCFGRGYTEYDADGVGVAESGLGLWKALTTNVRDVTTNTIGDYLFLPSNGATPGRDTIAPGDSGGNCFTADGLLAGSIASSNCTAEDPNVLCNEANAISINGSNIVAISRFANYFGEAINGRVAVSTVPIQASELTNGWLWAPAGSNWPSYAKIGSRVHLRGAISSGTTNAPFTLPVGARPSSAVVLPIVTDGSSIGSLTVQPTGEVTISAEDNLSGNAQTFTSLEGLSFDLDSNGSTALTLKNSWAPVSARRRPAVSVVDGYVQFQGRMRNGTESLAFTLPSGFRPAVDEYLPVTLCQSRKGRLEIKTNGDVSVRAESGGIATSACSTYLDGVSFPLVAGSGSPAALENGWQASPFATSKPSFRNVKGVVRFEGAVVGGSTSRITTLPTRFRPATNVSLYVDTCNGNRGRLLIEPSGAVSLASTSAESSRCFTSLEGASFVL